MKNLNKILALVIVLAMAFSTVAFAGTFSDVADTDSYAEAVEVLAALGLLNGYEDGTFGPTKTITRAEFAAVIIRALGLEDAATGAFGVSFDDVPANEWYAGYVMMAAQQGIINGYGDGTFKPSKDVKFEEAVKMIVCALGFQKKFENVADAYPTAYVAQAHTLGITTGANQAIGTDASRGIVARLVYNSLDVGKMAQVEYGTDQQWAQTSYTILSENLNIARVEGTVDSVSFANEAAKKLTYTPTKVAIQFVNTTSYTFPNPKFANITSANNPADSLGNRAKLNIEYADTVKPVKHLNTVAYIDMADEANPVMVALVEKPGANETLTITATQAKKANADISTTGDKVLEYYNTSWDIDGDTVKAKLDDNVKVYSNDDKLDFTTNFVANYKAGKYPVVTLINNDGKTGYDVIQVMSYYAGVVDEINDRINRITFKDDVSTGRPAALSLSATAEDVTFDIFAEDGTPIEFADIKVGDVVNVFESKEDNNRYLEVIVTSTKLEGAVSEVIDSTEKLFEIEGEEHYSYSALTAGDAGIFYVDMFGKVLKFELSEDSNRNFAVLYATYVDANGLDNEPKAVLYTANGEFVEYGFAKNVNRNGSSSQKYTTEAKEDFITDNGSSANPRYTINSSKLPTTQQIVMYSVNSAGLISEIYDGAGIKYRDDKYEAKGIQATKSYSANTGKLGAYSIPEGLTFVGLVDAGYQDGSTYPVKRANFSTADSSALVDDDVTTYDYDVIVKDKEAVFAVVFDFKAKVAADADVMFVTNISDATDSEGGSAKRITGYVNGLRTSVIAPSDVVKYDQNNAYNSSTSDIEALGVKKGAMIQYNGAEEISAIRILATDAEVIAWAKGTDQGSQLAYGSNQGSADEDNDKLGFLYVGSVVEYTSGAAEFSGLDMSVSSSAPTMLVRFNHTTSSDVTSTITTINNTYVNDYIVFGITETNEFKFEAKKDNAGNVIVPEANDDIVVIYSFDGEALATMVLDAHGDTAWN